MTTPAPSVPQWPYFYPPTSTEYSPNSADILSSIQRQGLSDSINTVNKNVYDRAESLAKGIDYVNKNVYDRSESIARGIDVVNKNVYDRSENIGNGIDTINKNIYDSTTGLRGVVETHTLGLRDAVERTGLVNSHAVERNASQINMAVERNGASNMSTTERVGANLLGTVERNAGESRLTTVVTDAANREASAGQARDIAVAIERTAANGMGTTERNASILLSAVDKNAGEARLTTVIADAANREASAAQARDLAVAIERTSANGAHTTERNASLLLSAVDKNAGEARLTTVVTDAASREAAANLARDISMAVERNGSASLNSIERNGGDTRTSVVQQNGETREALFGVRKDIIDNINRGTNEIMFSVNNQSAEVKAGINSSAWETRNNLNQGFATIALAPPRAKDSLAAQASQNFASLQLEGQKSKELLSVQLADSKYEALKNQQSLSAQMANSTNMLATQSAAGIADAKYEALKNQQILSAQLAECCCDIKSRVDQRAMDVSTLVGTLDTNRLRDNWVTARDEVNIYRVFDRFNHDRSPRRSRSPRRDFPRGGEEGGRR